jgi:hypothetical protein
MKIQWLVISSANKRAAGDATSDDPESANNPAAAPRRADKEATP